MVCKGLKEGIQSVNQYLFAINAALWDLKNEYKTEDDDSGHEEAERDVLEVCEREGGGRGGEREGRREKEREVKRERERGGGRGGGEREGMLKEKRYFPSS